LPYVNARLPAASKRSAFFAIFQHGNPRCYTIFLFSIIGAVKILQAKGSGEQNFPKVLLV
jgi:hypothetical protein